MSGNEQITQLLERLGEGNNDALNELFPLVYTELLGLARAQMRREREGHTLNTTALVHEAYIKLVDQRNVEWQSRGHFYAIAAMVMRRILVNYAKMHTREKRGGGVVPVEFDDAIMPMSDERAEEIVALDEALVRLAEINERAGKVVECRFFGGLSIEETADALGIAPMTVKRDWTLAKSWLRRELDE
jgi:RNA polymerase sigma factor (TIGR02999 family)